MGSFNKRFTEYAKDNFISAEELQDLAKQGYSENYWTGSTRNGDQEQATRLTDEKDFWKKFKFNYKKKGGEKLGIAGVAGRADREKLINAYNNPKYGPPEAEKEKKEKEDKKFKGSIELLSEDDLNAALYKPKHRDTSAVDKKFNLGKIQAEVDEIKANAAPSPTLNFKKGLLKGIGSTAPKFEKPTPKANKVLSRLIDKASKFDSKMTFDMIPDKVQKQKAEALSKLGPSGKNYKPNENKIPFKPGEFGPWGLPSTTKAKGVSLKKNKKK